MDIPDYLTLLTELRGSALSLWAKYLTVALALVAFVGSVATLRPRSVVLLGALFLVFAFTNHNGLKKNFELRQEVKAAVDHIYKDQCLGREKDKRGAFCRDKEVNDGLFAKLNSNEKASAEKLLFHALVSLLIPLLLIGYAVVDSGRFNSKQAPATKTASAAVKAKRRFQKRITP